MRGPAESVRKIPGWARVGDLLRPSLCEAVEESKDLQRAFEEYSAEMDGKQWAERFGGSPRRSRNGESSPKQDLRKHSWPPTSSSPAEQPGTWALTIPATWSTPRRAARSCWGGGGRPPGKDRDLEAGDRSVARRYRHEDCHARQGQARRYPQGAVRGGYAKVGGQWLVLFRALDAVQDILALWARAGRGEEVELLTVDIADAFLNLRITEEERGFAVVRDAENTYYAYRGVPFGLGTAPLTWGRTSALLTRAAQAMHHRDKHRAETYVDEPLLAVRGSKRERARRLLITLVFWSALGARLALHKLHRCTTVPWIGAELQVQLDKARTDLAKVEEALGVAGLVPQVRPWVTMLWAAVTAMLGTRQRPQGTVFMPMVERPLLWIRSFLRGERGGISRHHTLRPSKQVQFFVRTDASTTGFGGILLSQEGVLTGTRSCRRTCWRPWGSPQGSPGT